MTDTISARQFTFLVASYIQGALLTMMYYYQCAGTDAWFTLLLAGALFIPFLLLYCKLFFTSGRGDIPGILLYSFGRKMGSALSWIYPAYFVYVSSLSLRQVSQFVSADILPEIPVWLPAVLIAAVCWVGCCGGIRFFASASAAVCAILYGLLILLTILLMPDLKPEYLLPVLRAPVSDYLRGSAVVLTVPFGELVGMLMLMPYVRFEETPERRFPLFRSFFGGVLLGLIFILILMLRDSMVLGPFISVLSYPSYEVLRFAGFGSVLTRIESIFDLPFIFIVFFRLSVQIWCATQLLTRLLHKEKRRLCALLVCSTEAVLSIFVVSSNITLLNQLVSWIPVVFLIPQVLVPLCALPFALSKKKKSSMILP